MAFAVRADSPIKSAADLLKRLKADPASITFAISNAAGNQNPIAVAQVIKSIGGDTKKLKIVIFNGSGDAMAALLGGTHRRPAHCPVGPVASCRSREGSDDCSSGGSAIGRPIVSRPDLERAGCRLGLGSLVRLGRAQRMTEQQIRYRTRSLRSWCSYLSGSRIWKRTSERISTWMLLKPEK